MTEVLEKLVTAWTNKEDIFVIHYACSGFLENQTELPRVAAIAVRSLTGSQLELFSRTNCVADANSDDAEIELLEKYMNFIKAKSGAKFIHWNMSNSTYGFQALESRLAQLKGGANSSLVNTSNCFDLDTILERKFGEGYAKHPKLRATAELNGFTPRYALLGSEEASCVNEQKYAFVDQSLYEKLEWIHALAILAIEGRLRTLNSFGRSQFAGAEIDASAIIKEIARKFLDVSRQLGRRHGNRPAMQFVDEYDDQDLLHALLKMFFDDIRREEHTPSYAGSSSRIDFVLPEIGIAIELKHIRNGLKEGELGKQLIEDKARYSKHPDVLHLLCIVFDHEGQLPNPHGIERDLTVARGRDELPTTVVVIDR